MAIVFAKVFRLTLLFLGDIMDMLGVCLPGEVAAQAAVQKHGNSWRREAKERMFADFERSVSMAIFVQKKRLLSYVCDLLMLLVCIRQITPY